MTDAIGMDAPYVERLRRSNAARRNFACTPITFTERWIDVERATTKTVAGAASDMKNVRLASTVAKNRDSTCYEAIYFIGPPEGFPIKIGVSCDPYSRLAQLQTSHWIEMVIHGALWSEAGQAAPIEQEAHRLARLGGLLERGEWVWATLETAVDLVVEAAQKTSLPILTPAMLIHNQGMAMLARDKVA